MNSILEDLYLGNLRPSDQVNPQCREYREIREKRSEKINLVMEGLNETEPALKKEHRNCGYGGRRGLLRDDRGFHRGISVGS